MIVIMNINKISFSEIKSFWIREKHFNNVHKKTINEKIDSLGPYKCEIENPKIQAYGLFDADNLIGVTQIQEWKNDTVRWRTNNIIPSYRGNDLAWFLLRNVVKDDWSDFKMLFGWFRESAYGWAPKHGFNDYDGQWHMNENNLYIGVIQEIKRI